MPDDPSPQGWERVTGHVFRERMEGTGHMGLNVSHNAWRGAYTAFHRFRMAICDATGGRFDEKERMWWFGEGYDSETHPGLFEFLGHSDCDGEISPELAGKLSDEMELLLPELEVFGDGDGHISSQGGYAAVARKWIAGCRAACAAGESLTFC